MALTQAAERAALNKIIDYLEEDPEKNIDTIMTLVDKFVPEHVLPSQRRAFDTAIRERNNWYRLMMRIFDLNPEVRTKLLKTLIVDCSVLAWPYQEKMREKHQCNIPYAILLDPTSACNLRCTGCWAAEYGHALNLSFEDIDSIICQARSSAAISTSTPAASRSCARMTSSACARSTRIAHFCASPMRPSSTRRSARR